MRRARHNHRILPHMMPQQTGTEFTDVSSLPRLSYITFPKCANLVIVIGAQENLSRKFFVTLEYQDWVALADILDTFGYGKRI